MDVTSTELPDGWSWVSDPQERRSLEAELAREMPPKHILIGRSVRLVARHDRRDEVLFHLGDREVAQVHLTWNAESDPLFPHTEEHPSLEAWANGADHKAVRVALGLGWGTAEKRMVNARPR